MCRFLNLIYGRFCCTVCWYLLKIPGRARPELVEGRWFRQVQPTLPQFIEKMPQNAKKPVSYYSFSDKRLVSKIGELTMACFKVKQANGARFVPGPTQCAGIDDAAATDDFVTAAVGMAVAWGSTDRETELELRSALCAEISKRPARLG